MDFNPLDIVDEGFLIVDEEQTERHRKRLDEDTFTMNPDEGFEEGQYEEEDW